MADQPQPPEPPGGWLPPAPAGGPPQAPPPPRYHPPPPPPQQPPVYTPPPPNGEAVAGFTCSLTGVGLLFFSMGLSTIVSLILGVVGIVYARRGRRAVEEGKTAKHGDLARAGFVIGIVTAALSVLATVAWVLIIALADWDDDDDYDYDDPDEFYYQVVPRLLAGAVRLVG